MEYARRVAFRSRADRRGVGLISDVLAFRRLWYIETDDAIDYAKFFSRSHDRRNSRLRRPGNVIETHEHKDK
jgi:hypothetical protein